MCLCNRGDGPEGGRERAQEGWGEGEEWGIKKANMDSYLSDVENETNED